MNQRKEYKTYTRHDSLRLQGFDYASRQIYSVTIVVLNRRNIFLDERIANTTLDCLLNLKQQLQFKIYCYCLMPDHFHVLLGLGESNKSLSEICGSFKSLSTRAYWQWHEGKLWQRQFFDHIIRNEKDFFETMNYIKMNPVRKGLVEKFEEWSYTALIDELE
jgi:putative transposase